jgi:hypothetical protein
MNVRDKIAALAAAALLIVSEACVIAVVDYPADRSFPSETSTELYDFREGGELILENMDGDIEISGWDRNEVEVVFEKYFSPPAGGRFGIYGRRDFVPQVDVEEAEGSLQIRTRLREMEMGRVNFILKVPYSVNLRRIIGREGKIRISGVYGLANLEMIKGNIEVENYSGSLYVFVEDGSIQAELMDLHNMDEIRLNANSGDVSISLAENSSASIEASVSEGEIISEFDYGEQESESRVSFLIGEEGARIQLATLSGDIYIRRSVKEEYLQSAVNQEK